MDSEDLELEKNTLCRKSKIDYGWNLELKGRGEKNKAPQRGKYGAIPNGSH